MTEDKKGEWQPIDGYLNRSDYTSWPEDAVWLRAEGYEPALGSYGWDEEHYGGYDCAWHAGTGLDPLGFEPEEYFVPTPPVESRP